MESDSRNAPGDFCVERDCCTLCGVPWNIAPELFAYDDNGCWVARQPAGSDEEQKMLRVIEAQELNCICYRGDDARILSAIEKAGEWRR